ncbi:MAG: methyltransferase domain-containing protein [Rhodoferax sp.]|nr:methyltransferase domain-containing protein [Rhodoferax sp.]
MATTATLPTTGPSDWVRRWSHLVPANGRVLDLACGHGRHMQWFASLGHPVFGLDRSAEAIAAATAFGQGLVADVESGPWPLLQESGAPETFAAVVVTNYLWRPLFKCIALSLQPGGVLIYETFASGQETIGRPSRAEFLLQPGELLHAFSDLRVVAFEDGFSDRPDRFVQRIAAVKPRLTPEPTNQARRYRLA